MLFNSIVWFLCFISAIKQKWLPESLFVKYMKKAKQIKELGIFF